MLKPIKIQTYFIERMLGMPPNSENYTEKRRAPTDLVPVITSGCSIESALRKYPDSPYVMIPRDCLMLTKFVGVAKLSPSKNMLNALTWSFNKKGLTYFRPLLESIWSRLQSEPYSVFEETAAKFYRGLEAERLKDIAALETKIVALQEAM